MRLGSRPGRQSSKQTAHCIGLLHQMGVIAVTGSLPFFFTDNLKIACSSSATFYDGIYNLNRPEWPSLTEIAC